MDKRAIFVIVFFFTLLSTFLVGIVAFLSHQTLLQVALYSLATMWIVGILSHLLLNNLYASVIKPYEEEKRMKILEEQMSREIDLDQIETVTDVQEKAKEVSDQIKDKKKASTLSKESPVVRS